MNNTYKVSGIIQERDFGEPFRERFFSITVTAEDRALAATKALFRVKKKEIFKLKGNVEVVLVC